MDARTIDTLGEEWAPLVDVSAVIDEFIAPYISGESVVADLGVGGGRIARAVAPCVRELYCFDVSRAMLRRARVALKDHQNITFVQLDQPRLPSHLSGALDFLYSFDVLVHVDLHTTWRYIREIERVLRSGRYALLHFADITKPLGWNLFHSQDRYTPEGFYFMSPQMIRALIEHTSCTVVKESQSSGDNLYYDRDYLVVIRKMTP
jgi:ubiquinone/menaquinone biosynthesis C-methylase UbiE